MKIRCIANTGDVLPTMCRDPLRGIDIDTQFPVTTGSSYPVYAVTLFLGTVWYYVLDDDRNPWPTWMPAPLFEVEDGSLPPTWSIGYFRFSREEQYPILSFPEWAADHHFYERLVDREDEAIQVFENRRREVEDS